MKYLKLAGVFILVVLAVVIFLALFIPTQQKLERSILVKAPAAAIYAQLSKLSNFSKWAVWNQRDSAATLKLIGPDATVGASTSWAGDPAISGKGEIIIDSLLPSRKIVHSIHFLEPNKADGQSQFVLAEANGGTLLTWKFKLETPRPKNIFNIFFNLDKKMGRDFEEGLQLIKASLETKNPVEAVKTYSINQVNFPATHFAVVHQEVKREDIPAFLAAHYTVINDEIKKKGVEGGDFQGLYYGWDGAYQVADFAAAIPIPAGTTIDNPIVHVIDIPATKAVSSDSYGAYSGLLDVEDALRKYLVDHQLTQQGPLIETYLKGPNNEADTAKWKTRVTVLVE